jgi:type I protein arginine methyltransferase
MKSLLKDRRIQSFYSKKLLTRDPKNYSSTYQKINREAFDHLREHELMLIDSPRVDAYHAAIARFVHPGDTVIDLGTGLGILAFFAAQQGAKKVYAIDHSKIILAAEQVARSNAIQRVEFLQIHSKQLSLDAPVDVIIHDQIGNFLLDEDMVENICELRDRLLKKGGRILPDTFDLFIEPVKIIDAQHVPLIKDMHVHGIDFSTLQENVAEEDYSYLWKTDPASVEFFLCDPQPIYSFNLQTIHPGDVPDTLEYARVVQHAGRLDGFIVYFQCAFDEDILITSGPFQNRATSWKYCLLRVDSQVFKAGDMLHFQLQTDELRIPITWRWYVR